MRGVVFTLPAELLVFMCEKETTSLAPGASTLCNNSRYSNVFLDSLATIPQSDIGTRVQDTEICLGG